MKSKHLHGFGFTSPIGRGRREAPGEGLRPNERAYLLTPTLSPWERGLAAVVAIHMAKQDCSAGESR